MAVDNGYGSGKPLSATESRNRRRKAAGLTIRPEPGKMPDKKPGTINKPKPGTVKPGFTNPKLPGLPKPPKPPKFGK